VRGKRVINLLYYDRLVGDHSRTGCAIEARLRLLQERNTTGVEVVKAASDLLSKEVREQEHDVRKAKRVTYLNRVGQLGRIRLDRTQRVRWRPQKPNDRWSHLPGEPCALKGASTVREGVVGNAPNSDEFARLRDWQPVRNGIPGR